MRTVTGTFQTILNAESANLCHIVYLELKTKPPLYLTSSDRDVSDGANTYLAAGGLTLSNIRNSAHDLSQNVELIVQEHVNGVTRADIEAGEYDDIYVEVDFIDWSSPTAGYMIAFAGYTTEVSVGTDGFITIQVDGDTSKTRPLAGEVYSPSCRNELGDSLCQFNINSTRFDFTVQGTPAPTQFKFGTDAVEANNYWTDGIVEWTTGFNAGLFFDIRRYTQTNGLTRLWTRTPYTIVAGDTGYLYQGCPKTVKACRDTFDNLLNFRGEPYLPPSDVLPTRPTPRPNPPNRRSKRPCDPYGGLP